MIASFSQVTDVKNFDWNSLEDNFVIKPAGGYAGEGIVLIRKRISARSSIVIPAKAGIYLNRFPIKSGMTDENRKLKTDNNNHRFQLMDGSVTTLNDLKLHVLDILEGRFNRLNLQDTAIIEERVYKHPKFRRYAYQGTPDVRIIVFNKVPVMAALRLPTPESKGRANIHQGAIMVGIDLATGTTTTASHWDRPISRVPESNFRLAGLEIPDWDRMMELAVMVQENVALGYMAVDFLIDPLKGPLIVELTARPGMGIQIANMAGLRRRIERVEGLEDVTPGRGIEVAKALFAERFSDKIMAERGVKVVSVFEMAKLRDAKGRKSEIPAKIDTGAFRSSINRELAEEMGLMKDRAVLWHDYYRSSLGREKRPVISVTFWLAGRKIETTANVSDRSKMKEKLLIGRRDLSTFMVRPGNR